MTCDPKVGLPEHALSAVGLSFDALTSRQLENRVAETREDVGRKERYLALIRLREIARGSVQIDRKFARALGVEDLRKPCGDHARQQIASTAGCHTRVAREIDEGPSFRARDDRPMTFE